MKGIPGSKKQIYEREAIDKIPIAFLFLIRIEISLS